ncbi:Rieske 2Fe-2S domain-containing protein [Nocardioides sp. HM23]|uniref:Rieske 2Fe-2S domain-containing protein n=1 Tax=Nocardioides bizhenqiangii TaxID=3095076 RepID=UPI002ACAD85E|nr:Rieske 2Fe-2S domain-containing protein [Nocardioides sp. HM23]MDZ5621081.1 Rieske 2Fe-2S domain-containing protein [Nocardioides sp. HM23]
MTTTDGRAPASDAGAGPGYTLHHSAFVSAASLEDEMRGVFSNTWQYVGPLAKLQHPGDHVVATLGRTSVVVSRDVDDSLKGMVNICRHRLHPVALEDGSRKGPAMPLPRVELQARWLAAERTTVPRRAAVGQI